MSQVQFANQFEQLLSLHKGVERKQVVPQAWAFKPHESPYINLNIHKQNNVEVTLDLTLKCIKPKLNLSLTVDTFENSLIHSLKASILAGLEQEGYLVQSTDLKILFKTKNLNDTMTISELTELVGSNEISLNIMIKHFEIKTEEIPEEADVEQHKSGTISNETWNKIHELLLNDLSKTQSEYLISKFKSVI